ncbi:MAG TPA: hypothetical protein VEW74_01335, partial [Candidatus Nitrosotalea sp.]|nr:hypothetical protein [Candidatus Nitrosotalea sp.]
MIHRPDGTYNFPTPNLQSKGGAQTPLIARIAVHDGTVDALDERARALTNDRRFFVRDLQTAAVLPAGAGSHFTLRLRYGERGDRLYPATGHGELNPARGYLSARFSAPVLPIAAAVNFFAGSPALAMRSGMLRDVDLRYFGIAGAGGALTPHLAGTALLSGGSVAIAGLSTPIDGITGRMDLYDDGLLTRGLSARIARTAVVVDGGIFGLRDPHLRLSARGSGELAQLRTAFAQAARLPISGQLAFDLLVQGTPQHPTAWIALGSQRVVYESSPLDLLNALFAFDGNELDALQLRAAYGRVSLKARGRIAMVRKPNAVELLAAASSPAGAAPYAGQLLPRVPLDAAVLATADDPKALAVRGALWGAAGAQRLDGTFDVDARGDGTIGPVTATAGNGTLYARVALDRTHALSFGLLDARDFPLLPARAVLNGSFAGGDLKGAIATIGAVRFASAFGNTSARGDVTAANGMLRGTIAGDLGDGEFGAKIGGTLRSPVVSGTVVVAGGRYRTFSVNGAAGLSYYDGTLHVHDTAVALGPLFLGVAGTIRNLVPNGAFAPSYDLAAQVHSSDAAALMAAAQQHSVEPVQGSVDANLHVRGSGTAPSFAGTVDAPEGSVNGLSFRDLHGMVAADAGSLA